MPFWYVKQWNIPEQHYSFLALFSVICYILALFIIRCMIKKKSLDYLLKSAIYLVLGITMLSVLFFAFGLSGVFYLVLIMSLFAIVSVMIFPTANALLLDIFKDNAGIISAVSTTVLFLTAGLLAFIESKFNVLNFENLAVFLVIISSACFLSNYILIPCRRRQQIHNVYIEKLSFFNRLAIKLRIRFLSLIKAVTR